MAQTGSGRITPVILSGGSGKRLWPLSRPGRPKQLIALIGDESLLQQTARRVDDPTRFGAPIIVAGQDHSDLIETQLADIGVVPETLILEPCARNTGPAIALAALSRGGEDLLLVLPSDHKVEDAKAFRAAVEAASPFALDGWLVTLGITPDRAETGYGYIRRGEALGEGVFRAEAFVEKPDRETAGRYLAEGGYGWNAGIFLFRADAYLSALEEHAPDILIAVRGSLAASRRDGNRLFPNPDAFAQAPSQPIDTAVMEKSDRVAVAPVEMGWSDVGSWDSLYALGARDKEGNVVAGDAFAFDSRNCLIHSDGPAVVAIGVEDLIVIATGDAVLVVPRGDSQRVKDALDALIKRGQRTPDDPPEGG